MDEIADYAEENALMHWNHRVMRHVEEDGEVWYGLHEVFYKDEKVDMWTEEPISIREETMDEMRETAGRITRALEKPILDHKTGKEIENGTNQGD